MGKKSTHKGLEFVWFFGPVLEALRVLGGSGRPAEVREKVAELALVPDEKRAEVLPGNGRPRFDNQVAWARFYLAKAGLIDASQRGVWSLTDHGRATRLNSYAEANKVYEKVRLLLGDVTSVEDSDAPPAETSTTSPSGDHRSLLLETLKGLSPAGFERLCQRLLREAGFEEVVVTGRSGDGGIDGNGVLQINPLVSFRVLFQCKRYAGNVSAAQVRDFRGAMQGRTDKGIILTTGGFTPDAQKEAFRDGAPPIELVNGEKLIEMFEKLELGLRPRTTYDVDLTFFDDFR